MNLQNKPVTESTSDLLHNISVLADVTWLPSHYYKLQHAILHVCCRYPTDVKPTPRKTLTLCDGSKVDLTPLSSAVFRGLPMATTLLLDPGKEYGPVQPLEMRESAGNMVRHVLCTAVPLDVIPSDPEWLKVRVMYTMLQTMIKTLRRSAHGLRIYGLTEVQVPEPGRSIVTERGNVQALLTGSSHEGVEYLNIEIRVTMFVLATTPKLVPYEERNTL